MSKTSTQIVDWTSWPQAGECDIIFSAFEQARPDALRLVGGCVRDSVLKQPPCDIDFATSLTPDETMSVLEKASIKYVPTGLDHGTVTAVINKKPFEITSLRKDIETDGRHAVVSFTTDWSKDAERRDFTMNALYVDRGKTLHDPTGSGYQDCLDKNLRFIGDPKGRITEDALRILRYFRFLAQIDSKNTSKDDLQACEELQPLLSKISIERITMEILKLLSCPNPIFALEKMKHTRIWNRLTSLDIDIDKFLNFLTQEKTLKLSINSLNRWLFLNNPGPARSTSLDQKDPVFSALRLSNRQKKDVSSVNSAINWLSMRALINGNDMDMEVYHAAYLFGQKAVSKAGPHLCATGPAKWETIFSPKLIGDLQNWTRPVFPVRGSDLIDLDLAEGAKIGAALETLETIWLRSDFTLSKEALLAHLVEKTRSD